MRAFGLALLCACNFALATPGYKPDIPLSPSELIVANQYIERLDALYASKKHDAVFAEISKRYGTFYPAISAGWLNYTITRHVEAMGDSRYLYSYAYSLYPHIKLMQGTDDERTLEKTALVMMKLARLLLVLDASRCKDAHIALVTRIENYEENKAGRELLTRYANKSQEYKREVNCTVLRFEEYAKSRPPQRWLCATSLENMRKSLQRDPECKSCKQFKDANGASVTLVPVDESQEMEFDDAAWLKMRNEMREWLAKRCDK